MESINEIISELKINQCMSDLENKVKEKLKQRENYLATEYATYCLDVRQELNDRPMTYIEWYEAQKLE